MAFISLLLKALPCLSIPTPASLHSPVTLLFQNNLNWTDDANHISMVLLEQPMSYTAAVSACSFLNETLLSNQAIKAHVSDIIPQLEYLNFKGKFPASQQFWVEEAAVSLVGGSSLRTVAVSSLKSSSLPALCRQSALGTTQQTSLAISTNKITTSTHLSTQNTFTGFRDKKSFRFLGIPYSNSIIRFEHSMLNTKRATDFDATSFGATCFQSGSGTFSEQCSFLNVFTPFIPSSSSKKGDLRPVVVWIHGGAFTSGAGSDPTMDGGNLASRGDVVEVTINYRLSSLGFLAVPNTTITGNFGIGDQVTALEWVQENIHLFGGDKQRVTIWGQSAGGGSVRALMASPKATGKFAAAIPSSNLAGYDYATTYSKYLTIDEEATLAAIPIIQETNCADQADVVECLSQFDAASLVTLPDVARYVVVDHDYILSDSLQVTGKGPVAKVPVLWGTTADDGAAFIGYPSANESLQTAIETILTTDLTDAVLSSSLFPLPDTGNSTLDIFNVTARIATDSLFRCLDQATVFSALNHHVLEDAWYYQFDRSYQTPGFDPNKPVCDTPITDVFPNGDPSLPYFKCHSGDLYFQFGTLGQFGLPFRDADDVLFMQLVMDHWTSFVRDHDPNPDQGFLAARGYTSTLAAVRKSGHWDQVTKTKQTLRRLDVPSKQDSFLELEQCTLLHLPLTYYETAL
ncbi:cholinesterase [Mycena floridula]|nr:cholinesterase [Mycena floridula]